jgi:hypothetical protein
MQKRSNQEEQPDRNEAVDRSSRRKLLRAGAFFVPAIVTLHARAALADATLNRNYSTKGYVYGDNQGMTTFDVIAAQHPGGTWTYDRQTGGYTYTYTDESGTHSTTYTYKN